MFSADHPYQSMVQARAFVERLPVSAADEERIAHGNAERLFRRVTAGASPYEAGRVYLKSARSVGSLVVGTLALCSADARSASGRDSHQAADAPAAAGAPASTTLPADTSASPSTAARNPPAAPSPSGAERANAGATCCRAVEAGGGGKRVAGRILRAGDLAGEPVQCAGGEPQGRRGHRAIHAAHRGLARPGRPVRSDRGAAPCGRAICAICAAQFGNLGLAAAGLQCRARPGERLARRSPRGCLAETRNYVAVVTGWTADEWASPSRRRRTPRRPSRKACRAPGWPI